MDDTGIPSALAAEIMPSIALKIKLQSSILTLLRPKPRIAMVRHPVGNLHLHFVL